MIRRINNSEFPILKLLSTRQIVSFINIFSYSIVCIGISVLCYSALSSLGLTGKILFLEEYKGINEFLIIAPAFLVYSITERQLKKDFELKRGIKRR